MEDLINLDKDNMHLFDSFGPNKKAPTSTTSTTLHDLGTQTQLSRKQNLEVLRWKTSSSSLVNGNSSISGSKTGPIKVQSNHTNIMRGKYLKDVSKWNKDKVFNRERSECSRHSSVDRHSSKLFSR